MNDGTLADLIEAERRRGKRKPPTAEQRAKSRAVSGWSRNLGSAWSYAQFATDDELRWLSAITEASKAKPGRTVTNRFFGRTYTVGQHTSGDDAAALAKLSKALKRLCWDAEWQRRVAERRDAREKVIANLRRLGLPVPRHISEDPWLLAD
jgi:hypothetical protein